MDLEAKDLQCSSGNDVGTKPQYHNIVLLLLSSQSLTYPVKWTQNIVSGEQIHTQRGAVTCLRLM
jgi:hypothetical protein